jgi:RimJ/RimL family protein N-acetyltransferase
MIQLLGFPVIETDRLRLRGPKPEDFEVFAAFFTTSRARYVGGQISRAQAWRGFCHVVGHGPMRGFAPFMIADKDTDACLGMAGPWFPEGWPEPEILWSLWAPAAEGKGLAFEAVTAARAYAYARLGWTTAISLIAVNNIRSQSLALRLGCRLESEYAHETHGEMQIWRHPAPEALR